jgi:hypothetical protein
MMTRANFVYNSTAKIKVLADVRPIAIDDADSIIRSYHLNLVAKNSEKTLQNGEGILNGNGALNGNGH